MQAFVAHQASLSHIKYSSILHDLSITNRSHTAVEFSQEFVDLISNTSVYNLYDPLLKLQKEMPGAWTFDEGYMLTFGATVTTAISLILPEFYGEALLCIIAKGILDETSAEFLINKYQPAFYKAIKGKLITKT